MAFRRRTHRRRHKRPAFSKRQAKAIVRIAQKPVETKTFATFSTFSGLLLSAGYTGSLSNFGVRGNILSQLPSSKNTSVSTDESFVGDEIVLRGFRFDAAFWLIASTPGVTYDCWFRFTVYSANDYIGSITRLGPNPQEFDPENSGIETLSKWNMNYVKIHAQKAFRVDNNGNLNGLIKKKFWVPLRRKIVKADELAGIPPEYMGEVKGMQLYWALEIFMPGLPTTLPTNVFGQLTWTTYFKDA